MPEYKAVTDKKQRFSPLLLRIAVINLISLLVLSLFNYFTFYNKSNKAFMQTLTQYNERVASIAFKNINSQIIQSATEIPYRFFSDIATNETLLLPQLKDISAQPSAVLNLHTKLNELLAGFPMVHSINVYYEATNTIVTGRGNVHFVQTQNERDLYLPWYADYSASNKTFDIKYLEKKVYPKQIYKTADLSYGNDKLVSVISTISNSKWNGSKLVVAVHILPTFFSEFIDETQGQFIIAGANGEEIYSTPGSATEASQVIAAAAEMPNGTAKLDELRVVVSKGSNDALGLRYYHAIPYSVFFKDYNLYLKELIVLYCLSVFAIFTILMLISYFSNSEYRKRLLLSTKKVGLNLSDDQSFDSSLEKLTSQFSSMNTEMQQSRPILYYNHVRSLIFGRQAGAAYAELASSVNGFEGVFCVLVNLKSGDSSKLDLVSVQNSLQENAQSYGVLITTLEQNLLCIVVCTNLKQEAATREVICGRIQALFTDFYMADGQMEPFPERREQCFKTAYDSALYISRYHFVFPQQQQLSYREIGTVQLKNTGSHLKIFAEIEKDINSENLLAYKERVYDLTESFKYGNYSIDYCSSTLRDFVTLLYNIVQSRQLDMWLAFGYDIRAKYKQVEDIDEFYRWGCEMGEILMQNLRQRKKAHAPDLQSRIIQLIDENLENNISLEFLADSLGQRSDVLSRTFKQLMGKSYVEYIKDKKLTLAKRYIAEGLSIKAVSERLGYSSPQYFIKIFKETYAITPYQYKKSGMPEE